MHRVRTLEQMSSLLLDNIVDKNALDIEPDYLKIIKVSSIFLLRNLICDLLTNEQLWKEIDVML